MPGYELINHKEKNAVNKLFKEGGILFAHGFDNLRKFGLISKDIEPNRIKS